MNFPRIQQLHESQGTKVLDIKVGRNIEIHEKIGEGDNQRIWKFKGVIIKIQKPQNPDGTFTIRGTSAGMVIEKVYPLSFPKFEKILLEDQYKIRKAKLYFIREKIGKAARFKSIIKASDRDTNLIKK